MQKLSKKQRHLMDLIEVQGKTLSEAAVLLKISRDAAKKLRSRAYKSRLGSSQKFPQEMSPWVRDIGRGTFLMEKQGGLNEQGKIRLHNLQFHICPNWIGETYHQRRLKSNALSLGEGSLVLSANSFELYWNGSFFGEDADSCLQAALVFFWDYFRKLEQRLGVVFVKDQGANVRIVRSHYSDVGNGLARDYNARKQKLRILGKDGKLWLVIDNSLNLNELELVHSQKSRQDMNKLKPFFNDLEQMQEPWLLSDIVQTLKVMGDNLAETTKGLNAVVQVLKIQHPDQVQPDQSGDLRLDYVG